MNIEETIREHIIDNFLMGDTSRLAGDKVSFLDTGIIDSTGVLELVMFVEESFDIKVEDDELLPENLDSVENLTGFIRKKQGAKQPVKD
ncbi:MAG: acyl carrier protein [candidate division Zixibacteria bacterium]|nr:acyl carrier protein [candidate division Zixibacteria bacterium]